MPVVYLVGTPEIEKNLITGVQGILQVIKGPIKFVVADTLKDEEKSTWYQNLVSKENKFPYYKTEELLQLAVGYRGIRKILKDNFVVVFTSLPHEKNWFSAVDKKDIFVTTRNWENFISKDPKIAMAHQVIENIQQSMLGVFWHNANEANPNVHFKQQYCLNDFCRKKSQILAKMLTARICEDCREAIRKRRIPLNVSNHIVESVEYIRILLNKPVENADFDKIKEISIDSKCRIKVDQKEINLTPTQTLLYVFFLIQKKPVKRLDLHKYVSHFQQIKNKIGIGKFNRDPIKNLTNKEKDNVFNSTISQINQNLKGILGESAEILLIGVHNGRNNGYSICLDHKYRKIEFSIP